MTELILTEDQFRTIATSAAPPKIVRKANHSLNRLGSVDICTTADREVFAVVHFARIDDALRKEVTALLDQAKAKLAPPETTPAPAPAAEPAV